MTERRHRVKKEHWSEILRKAGACRADVRFASQFDTLKEAWDACPSPGWLFWLLGRIEDSERIPNKQLARFRVAMLDNDCAYCRSYLCLETWRDVFIDLSTHSVIDADGVRAIFPNPPRFRDGAGE